MVFTSFHGRGYRGNPRALFEHLVATERLDPVWLSTRPAIVQRLRLRYGGRRAALAHSPAGVRALASARAIVLSHGITDLPYLHLNRRAIVLQAWHGLPTKRGELWDGGLTLGKRLALRRMWAPIDYVLSSSPLVSEIYGRRFGVPRERFVELGYPAYDDLSRPEGTLDTGRAFPEAPPHERVVLYAPTFRKAAPTRLFPFADLDPAALARYLEDRRAIVCLRPHPNDRLEVAKALAISPRIVLADDRRLEDVMPLLRRADVVVTDYSGIFLEATLIDVPSVFVPYDLQAYERGLPWDYASHTPGPKVDDLAGFLAGLDRAFDRPDLDAADRRRVRDLFFTYTDGRATERVAAWLERTLEGAP